MNPTERALLEAVLKARAAVEADRRRTKRNIQLRNDMMMAAIRYRDLNGSQALTDQAVATAGGVSRPLLFKIKTQT